MCWEKMMVKGGIFAILIGVFLWLNDTFAWFTWPQFIAVILIAKGICMLMWKSHMMCKPMPMAAKPMKRKRK